jgi:hypothetical protein
MIGASVTPSALPIGSDIIEAVEILAALSRMVNRRRAPLNLRFYYNYNIILITIDYTLRE